MGFWLRRAYTLPFAFSVSGAGSGFLAFFASASALASFAASVASACLRSAHSGEEPGAQDGPSSSCTESSASERAPKKD